MMEISRRNFLTGAGIAAAGAAAMGLAGCASPKSASSKAAETTTTSNGTTVGYDGTGTMPWLPEEPSITDSDIEEEIDCDVVVCGLGAAGVPAARAAAESGASVVCFEKSASFNSVASDMAIYGGETQKAWGRGDGDELLDKDMLCEEHMIGGSHRSDYGIVRRWADESGAALDWFIKPCSDLYISSTSYGEIPAEGQSNYLFPYFVPMLETYDYTKESMPCYPTSVGFSSLATCMKENLQVAIDAGADIRYTTPVVDLIVDDSGAVTGVYAQAHGSKKYIKCNAKKGVVIATGDYLANEEMTKFFQPNNIENEIPILCVAMDADGEYALQGDALKMLAWHGAEIERSHASIIHHMGAGAGADGRGVIGNNGYLWLNKRGKRFMNEDVPGQQVENQVENQPGKVAYQFFDAAWPDQLKYFPAAHGIACYYLEEDLPEYTASGLKINCRTKKDIEDAVADGRCVTSDTIEGLLAQLEGIDVETAKKSIEHYNELANAGVDTDFGKVSSRLFPLSTPPFYAAECGVALNLGSLGGVVSDADCHVYNTDGEIIKGVYVAGAPQGGRFNVQYPIDLKGMSCGMCMMFGKIAGENAANQA
ncbi:succinate dehydrogenase [Denitrobacterium detoxificans]|nr:succinate dehydrogenase [Denitrobacterium detoxificans]